MWSGSVELQGSRAGGQRERSSESSTHHPSTNTPEILLAQDAHGQELGPLGSATAAPAYPQEWD